VNDVAHAGSPELPTAPPDRDNLTAPPTIEEKAPWTGPLHVLLALVMAALLAVTSTILIGIDYWRGRSAALEDSAHRMRVFSERLVDRYLILFADTRALIGFAAASDVFRAPPPDSLQAKTDFLREIASQASDIDGAYAGYADGSFVHVVPLARDQGWRDILSAPSGAAFAARTIMPTPDGSRRSVWSFLDADGRPVGAQPPLPVRYDPTNRPWYRMAEGAPGMVATEPYVMATTRALGITVAQAHRNGRGGVIGADVLLDTISRFLAEERISPGSAAFVVNARGRPTIHSDPAVMKRIIGMPADASVAIPDPLLQAMTAAGLRSNDVKLVEAEGRSYLALARAAGDLPLLEDRRIVVTAPIDELTADADRALRQGLLVSALVLVAGIVCAILLARRLAVALQQLTFAAQRLQRLDFETAAVVRSHVTEISALARAMTTARAAIRTFGLYVPRELVRRIVEAASPRCSPTSTTLRPSASSIRPKRSWRCCRPISTSSASRWRSTAAPSSSSSATPSSPCGTRR
jgi:adenylate cyclase